MCLPWCASQGGVYVIKRAGISTNPYLVSVGVHADVRCTEGLVLTLRNPALVVREVFELSAEKSGVSFRVVSLKPLNPKKHPG